VKYGNTAITRRRRVGAGTKLGPGTVGGPFLITNYNIRMYEFTNFIRITIYTNPAQLYRAVFLVVSRVCGDRIACAADSSVRRSHADVFGTVALRATISLVFRYFMAEGIVMYKYVPYLGWGLISNPQVAKKGNFRCLAPCEAISSPQDDSR
jgi:hypothetical protein